MTPLPAGLPAKPSLLQPPDKAAARSLPKPAHFPAESRVTDVHSLRIKAKGRSTALGPDPKICPLRAPPSRLSPLDRHQLQLGSSPNSDLAHSFPLPNTPLCVSCLHPCPKREQGLESHQDYLNPEGTENSGPCLPNGSFENWLFGTTRKTFSSRSHVLNWRAAAVHVLHGRRVGI